MAAIFVKLLGIYFGIGLLFGIWFVMKGVGKMDENATSVSWKMRLLWLPGAVGLWSILVKKNLNNNT